MNELYDFYIRGQEELPVRKMFRGTVSDFEKVEKLYEELWSKVIDAQLSLGTPLTEDEILLSWEGGEIIAEHITTYEQYWYLGDGKLEAIGTQVIGR